MLISGTRSRRLVVAVGVCSLVLSACGTRVPRDRVVAANGAVVVDQVAGEPTGAVDGGGQAAVDGGAPQTSAAAPTRGAGGGSGRASSGAGSGSGRGSGAGGGTTNGGTGGGTGGGTTNGGTTGGGTSNGGTTNGGTGGVPASVCSGGTGTIKLGNVGPYSATGVGSTSAPGRDILNVWAASVNARGGICGRKVQMITRDDQGSAAQTSAIVKDLVENQKVVAFVGNNTALTLSAQQSYLEGKGVPVIGGDLATTAWFSSPDYFPQGASNNEVAYGGFKAPQKRPNGTKWAYLYCAEVSTCTTGFDALIKAKIPDKAGVQLVYTKKVSITQISFTAECQAAAKAGAGVMFAGGDSSFVERVANSCGQQGLKFAYVANGLSVSESQAKNKYLDGNLFVSTSVQPWTATNTKGAQEYARAIAQFGPGTVKSGTSITNWVAAKLAEYVLGTLGSGPVTSQTILNALRTKVRGFTADGLTAPLTFGSGAQRSPQCTGLILAQGGTFVPQNGGNLICRSGAPLG